VSNFLRRKRLPTYVSERLLDTLTTIGSEARDDGAEPYLVALRRCRDKLDATDEELLKLRTSKNLASAKSLTDCYDSSRTYVVR